MSDQFAIASRSEHVSCIIAGAARCRDWGPSGTEGFKHCQIGSGSETIRYCIRWPMSESGSGSMSVIHYRPESGRSGSYLHVGGLVIKSREVEHDHVLFNEHGFSFRLRHCFETDTDSAYRLSVCTGLAAFERLKLPSSKL
jgi:hypothetical protein